MSCRRGLGVQGQKGFWDFGQGLEELSWEGDLLERLAARVDIGMFRPVLLRALRLGRKRRGAGGRPPYGPVLKFKMLVLQALHGLSLAQASCLVCDRLSWMRFCGLGPGDAVPDENMLWDFRETLIAAGALDRLFERLNAAMAAHDGAPLRECLIDPANAISDVWGDTAYRSAANEAYLARHGRHSRICHGKPCGKPMPVHMACGDRTKSRIRAKVEDVLAERKARMELFVRTIGLKRAKAMITLANMIHDMKRWCWLDRRSVPV